MILYGRKEIIFLPWAWHTGANYLTGNYEAIPALKPMKMLTGRVADGE